MHKSPYNNAKIEAQLANAGFVDNGIALWYHPADDVLIDGNAEIISIYVGDEPDALNPDEEKACLAKYGLEFEPYKW
jgi:hypothetical protein